jgi:hypothetical protein
MFLLCEILRSIGLKASGIVLMLQRFLCRLVEDSNRHRQKGRDIIGGLNELSVSQTLPEEKMYIRRNRNRG